MKIWGANFRWVVGIAITDMPMHAPVPDLSVCGSYPSGTMPEFSIP